MNTFLRNHGRHPDDPLFVLFDRVKWWTDAAGANPRYERGTIIDIDLWFSPRGGQMGVVEIEFDNKVLGRLAVRIEVVEFEADPEILTDDYFA